MGRLTAFIPILLALGATILAPRGGAQAQDRREKGPFEIEKCQTIDQPGSYKLVNNLTFTPGPAGGVCLLITANFVTIDLSGFTISGPGIREFAPPTTVAIEAREDLGTGISVRNGSILGFTTGVNLEGFGSIVEGLRVLCTEGIKATGIKATGIVRGNTVDGRPGGTGISATGVVTGNAVTEFIVTGISIGQGSTVIGNTAVGSGGINIEPVGIAVSCPSNVTDNTAIFNGGGNLVLSGDGCNNTNNVAPLTP